MGYEETRMLLSGKGSIPDGIIFLTIGEASLDGVRDQVPVNLRGKNYLMVRGRTQPGCTDRYGCGTGVVDP
jgi:hypothetical protein